MESTDIHNKTFVMNNHYFKSAKSVSYDSLSGIVLLNDTDTLHYRLGFVTSTLSEQCQNVVYLPDNVKSYLDSSMTEGTIFTNRKDFDLDKFRKQNFIFLRKNHEVWKLTYPIDTSNRGLIGIYIDSIKVIDGRVVKFAAFCNQISTGNYSNILESLKSIRINDFPDSVLLNSLVVP